MAGETPTDTRRGTGISARQGAAVAAGWLVLLFVGAYLITPASILPLMMADLGITEATAAALVSMPQVAATVIGIPVGVYLDRVDTRAVVPGAAAVLFAGSVGDWAAASGGTVLPLIASRLLAGVGMFVLWVVSINVASSIFPPDRRATATSVIISGYPAGYALGQLGAPRVAGVVGWPGVFPVFGGAVLLLSVAFYVAAGAVSRYGTAPAPATMAEFKSVFRNRNVWTVVVVTVLGYSLYMIFNSWMPTYLTRQFGVSLAESGSFVALFPAVGILARPAGGWLSDGWLGQRRRPVFAVSFLGAIVLAVAMFYSTTVRPRRGVHPASDRAVIPVGPGVRRSQRGRNRRRARERCGVARVVRRPRRCRGVGRNRRDVRRGVRIRGRSRRGRGTDRLADGGVGRRAPGVTGLPGSPCRLSAGRLSRLPGRRSTIDGAARHPPPRRAIYR